MSHGLETLTEREKETLRLLIGGHDAKSIARHLTLSVHTVNERLRDTRRKLGVSSSREAARLLAEGETNHPHSLGDRQLGVPGVTGGVPHNQRLDSQQWAARRLIWLCGGMLIMSLIIAAALFSTISQGSRATATQAAPTPAQASPSSSNVLQPASLSAAQSWVALLDRQRWEDSWGTAAHMFTSKVSASRWAAMAQSVLGPLGPLSTRSFHMVTKTNKLPGAPKGDYEVIEFKTSFANKRDAIETVVLVHEKSGWNVPGYFIR